IVDRAKIQRIIFEFDYYEKAFHQFYDTYRVVPGNLDYKTCIKHAEFSGCACSVAQGSCTDANCGLNYTVAQWCQKHSMARSVNSAKIVQSETDVGQFLNMLQLKKSGLIDKDRMKFNGHNGVQQNVVLNRHGRDTGSGINVGYFADCSFDNNLSLNFVGFKKYSNYEITDPTGGFIQRIQAISAANRLKKEFYNQSYTNALNNHNAIVIHRLNISASTGGGATRTDFAAALTAKITSQLDAKIDDGRPGTGKLLAYKDGRGSNKTAPDGEVKATCYDKDYSEVDKAIYHETTDLKYGCGVLRIMEDVK
ncbi:MAG: hypothetical protein IJT14_03335, partial [Rickettsiales bacterium]|nr:hypothetical protein [Rickettsiales bacterium]